MSSVVLREREQDDDDLERYSKRPKLDNDSPESGHILPPSHALLGISLPQTQPSGAINFLETNVGISEYVGLESAKIQGIIKQRYVLSTKQCMKL
jgi:tRNA pseudouridine13 synthase